MRKRQTKGTETKPLWTCPCCRRQFANREQLQSKGRGMIGVEVEVVGAGGVVGLIATVEWFVQKQKTP